VLGATIYWGIIKRIKHISHVAFRVSEGDHSLRAKDSGSDEIGFLARFFNEMLDSMEAHQEVLANAFDEISNREQNLTLTLTLQSIGDAVIVTDAQENIIRMNLVARELTGWSEFDAIGQPIGNIFNIIESNTRVELKNPVQEVMRTGNVVELGEHTTLVSASGREYHISDSAAPIKDENGVIHGVIMVFQDNTDEYNLQKALRESEQRLRMALQATEEGLWDWNIETGNVYYSPRWINMLGYDSGDILPDISSWKKLIHPDDLVGVMQKLQAHLRREAPVFEAEHRLKKEDGSYLWVQGRGKVTEYDNNGRPVRVVGTVSNISEEKEHEEHMRRAQKMEAMGKLTGGIAHDYNNMLGVILGYAELLQMQVSANPKQSMYVESILRAAERAKKLTNSLLKFSRRKETEAEAVDINALLKEDEDMLSKTLTARVELQLDLSLPLWPVYVDSGDLEDVILNMAINAMHAMTNGGVLTISTTNVTLGLNEAKVMGLQEGDYVCLALSDTGIGMDEETVERIFDPFFSTKGEQGTGLGLSQVYGFMQRSQGGIRVISEPGAGARFMLYFPRYHISAILSDRLPDDANRDYSGNETILVVDDEYALRSLAEEILSLQGYKVLQAQDASNALQLLKTHHVDLVLSDVIMPGINGYELARQIRENYPAIKIQMVSGFNSVEREVEIDQELQKGQLSKPFNAVEMLKRIRHLLDQKPRNVRLT
jgi:PAS domain S-box-containing protein